MVSSVQTVWIPNAYSAGKMHVVYKQLIQCGLVDPHQCLLSMSKLLPLQFPQLAKTFEVEAARVHTRLMCCVLNCPLPNV